MNMIITTGKHSYMKDKIDGTIEAGSTVFSPENKAQYMIIEPEVMVSVLDGQIYTETIEVSTAAELQSAMDSAEGKTVVLLNDIDMNKIRVTVNVNCTLDLNGYILTSKDKGDGGANSMAIYVVSGKTFTLMDSSEKQTGKVVSSCYGVYVKENAIFNMVGGIIELPGNAKYDLGVITWNSNFKMSGGTISARVGVWVCDYYDGPASNVEIVGGTILISGINHEDYGNSSIAIDDPSYPKGASIVIKGGSFNDDPSKTALEGKDETVNFVAEGYVSIEKEAGIYIVESLEAASIAYNQNNGMHYLTITEAINKANNGDTIVVKPGVYDEKIAPWVGDSTHKVEKSITLLGANADNEEWNSENETVLTGGLYLGYDDTKTRDHTITIKGFTFKGNNLKIACQKYVTIENNRFYNIEGTSPAILVMDAKEGSVSICNNVIQDCSAAGVETRRANDVVIENNIITNTTSNGILMSGAITGTSSVKNNIITNWTPAMAEGRAIRVVLNNGNLMANNNTLKYEDTALEEYIKVTGTGTINVSANYWNGLNPLENNIYLGLAETVTDEISSYYSDENMTKLI